jgi:hypothetical protein
MRAARFRLLAGVVLIALILFGQTLVGMATANGRLDSALRETTGPVNVVVVMDFTPERFHTERLSTYGVFAGRDKAVNRVRLRMVSPENLRRLADLAWVARIEPAR